ncbi:hypothetical protein SAPIO_CDS8890 [Scedosporium apiospermum]|uniref:NACHT domain-containing protein n=1 Tax=Pseudallescheria apiosperma TaxID=563466 RepID=A0A084FXW1_PSEDA|nr:uncharacterized protein SAPIO_CDS8890 [Scedosporium apiospermum]KEZ39923.1 hypothetical protein SAPIO_CDS8890 [Scedosporium apiospermum]
MSLALARPPSADASKVIRKAYRDFESIVNVSDARRFRNTTINDIASDYIEAFEVLIKSYARIGESLSRFELLGTVFVHNHGFQRILAVFYADILQFHKCAYKFVTLNGWRTFFLTTWGRFDRRFKSLLDDLKYHADLVDKEAMALNVANIQSILDKLESDRLENLERIEQEEKSETDKQYQAVLTRLQIDDSDQKTLWEGLLEALDFQGTCSWVLKHDKVASWLHDKGETRSIWLYGSAGSGKSVISACLAKFRVGDERMVVRHFCNSLYDSSTNYEKILKSIIRQLLQWSDDSTAYIYKTLAVERKMLSLSSLEIAVQELVTIVSGSFQERGLVWIILDGLDACEPSSLARLVALMDVITSKETGMFLYARLIIDFISVQLFLTGGEFKRAIDELPPELKGFYEKILSSIFHGLDPISTQRIKRVLGWVAFAERPLKRLEVLSAITFSEGVANPERLAPYFFLQDCSTLVEERHDKTVGFIHVSVKE